MTDDRDSRKPRPRMPEVPSRTVSRRRTVGLLALAGVVTGTPVMAQDTGQPGSVTIYGRADAGPVIGTDPDSGSTVYRIGGDGLDLLAGPGQVNPYAALSTLPSVNAPGLDPYGMANVPGGAKGLRIRGEQNPHGGIGTVDGLPLSGIDPGPGTQWLFDRENIASISVAEGPVSPDTNGLFSTDGAVDSQLLWPLAHAGVSVSQSFGSYDMRRSFLRVDSGEIGASRTAFFVSGSDMRAGKWRGPGESPDGRVAAQLGFESHPTPQLDVRLSMAYGHMAEDNYRPLTHAQATNLSQYRDLDYDATPNPMDILQYQGFNRQSFTDWVMLSEIRYAVSDDLHLLVKPYYTHERGEYHDGMAMMMPGMPMPMSMVRNWLVDHASYGVTAEVQARIASTDIKVGYWWSALEPPGPPTAWKMYSPNTDGSQTFRMWRILASDTTANHFNSVYLVAERHFGALNATAGVRYVRETLAGIDAYSTMGLSDVGYSQALAESPGVIPGQSVSSLTVDEALPYIALGYALSPAATLKLSAGRNYGAPGVDLWPMYQMSAAAFLARGITANQLWQTLRPETADAVDLGLRLGGADAYVEPTLFYSASDHKDVTYDPGIGAGYAQNVGKTHAYGAQLAAAMRLALQHLSLFATVSYDRNVFDADLPTFSGMPMRVNGLQLPDTPQWLASAGVQWSYADFRIAPQLRYSSSRFGDTMHTQEVAGYTLANLDLGYRHRFSVGTLQADLSLENLFDRRYVGFINASYLQMAATGSAIYYPGAPRTIVGRVALSF